MLFALAETVSATRRTIGWTQTELARRCGLSPSMISLVERGLAPNVSLGTVAAICDAMDVDVALALRVPFLGDRRRQGDPAHARCVAYVQRRMERAGWAVEREVETPGAGRRGWIDLLAYHQRRETLLLVEVKTELHDVGQIERTVGWYERVSWAAARQLGWRPTTSATALVVLATDVNDDRVRENREILGLAFPARASDVAAWIDAPTEARPVRRRGLAMIDPLSRRAAWLRPTRVEGRRSAAPYPDYAGFMSAVRGRSGRPGRT